MKQGDRPSGTNESEILVFLSALCSGKPNDLYLLIWTVRKKSSRWFQDVGGAIQFVASIATQDVYVGVGFSLQDFGPTKRCVADEIAGIHGMWADIDIKSEAHQKKTLPSTIEQALSILPPEFAPTLVIRTGNGIQAWWLFPEPWLFEGEDQRLAAAKVAYRWQSMLRDRASQRGWTYDRLADLSRVLRVPGTRNCKDPSNPKPVVIHSQSEFRYSPSEVIKYLDQLGVSDQDTEDKREKDWSQRFRHSPLKIDLAVRVDEDRLKRWSEADLRFKATWFRQRYDLTDHSQSGYDMALADFGVGVGLPDQDIVDLIVCHRMMHRQPPRTKANYYELTISKARAAVRSQSDPNLRQGFTEERGLGSEKTGRGNAEPPGPGPPGTELEKIHLCKDISAALGVEILRIVKVSGDNPFYRMELAAGSISFPTVDKFINRSAVRNGIAGRVNRLIPDFKPAAWRNLAQMMLDACIVEDGGEELESQGAARLCILQYLGETAFIPGIAGQLPQDLRKPMVRDDQIAICASDLQLYLNKARSQAISMPAVVAMLSAVGAKVERVRGKNFREQSRWMLPLDQFEPDDYASNIPGGSTEHA